MNPLLTLCITVFLTYISSCSCDLNISAEFSDPYLTGNMLVMDVHNETGDVFVAATNVLYHLDSKLVQKRKVPIGPDLDHPDCLHPSYPCNHTRYRRDNIPHVLKIIYHLDVPMLMLCGSLYSGLCQMRPIHDLYTPVWIRPYNESVGFTTVRSGTVFFDFDLHDVLAMYVGTDYVPSRTTRPSPAFASKKELLQINGGFTFSTNRIGTGVHVPALYFGDNIKRYMIYSFTYSVYVYFLYVHDDGDKKHTILASVCASDPSFQSYTELRITCGNENFKEGVFNIAMSAFFGEATANLKEVLEEPAEKALFVAFESVSAEGSVVCSYPLTLVRYFFNNASQDCFGPAKVTHLMNPVTGELSHCNPKPNMTITDYCGANINPYISGRKKLVGETSLKTSFVISAIAVFQQNEHMFAALVTDENVMVASLDSKELVHATSFKNQIAQPFMYFDPKMENVYFLADHKVVKYLTSWTCSMYKSCLTCSVKGVKNSLNCAWCNGQCSPRQECATQSPSGNDTCKPVIHKVTPLKGPTMGNTLLTIEGLHFGSFIDAQHNMILVAESNCTVISWTNEIVRCKTNVSSEAVTSAVGLGIMIDAKTFATTASKEKFSYVVPKLFGIHPSKGPVSGGTNVTLYGEDLDCGGQLQINIEGRRCAPHQIEFTKIICTTDYKMDPALEVKIEISFDSMNIPIMADSDFNDIDYIDIRVPLFKKFEYLPDPEIHRIHPTVTTMSQRVNLTVSGLYLDVVAEPRMLVYVPSSGNGQLEFVEPCFLMPHSNGAAMLCSTPSLQRNDGSIAAPETGGALVTHLAFIMDGVKELRDFSERHEKLSRLVYYPDPQYETFEGGMEVSPSSNSLELKGKYLDFVYSANTTLVTVGDKVPCNITSLTSNNLICTLPSDFLADSSMLGQKFPVQIFAGTTRYDLGYLSITEYTTGTGWMIGIGVLTLIIASICVIIIWYRKMKRQVLRSTKESIATTVLRDHQPVSVNSNAMKQSDLDPEVTVPLNRESTVVDEIVHLLENENLIICREHLKIHDVVGEGEFGCVYKGEIARPEDQVAIKVAVKTIKNISAPTERNIQAFLEEGLLMKSFRHENVLTLFGICFDGEIPMIFTPFMDLGDLKTFVRNTEIAITVPELLKFGVDVAAGMSYLASKRFVHRDLAARNCMLDNDLVVKVADFGLSRDIYESNYYTSENRKQKLPFKWTAPECLELQTYSEKSDVWSYGVLLWEVMTRGVIPYAYVDNFDLPDYLKSGRRLPMPQCCPKKLYKVMLQCWQEKPKDRPRFQFLKNCVHQLWRVALADETARTQLAPSLNTNYLSYEDPLTISSGSNSPTC